MHVVDLGVIDYEETLEIQAERLFQRIDDEVPDTLFLLEHEPVVTLGRIAQGSSIDSAYFERNGIPVVRTGRGGKNTYHAPGQLVVYPIVDLAAKKKDIAAYIDLLERVAANALNELGVPARGNLKRRGVWVKEKKIAFIGIALKKWVTYHGVSVNINNDTEAFSHMDPCGESDISVTSAKEYLGREIDMKEVKEVFAKEFCAGLERSENYGLEVIRAF